MKVERINNPKITHKVKYRGFASPMGGYVLFEFSPLQPYYKISATTGKGFGPIRMWRLDKDSHEALKILVRQERKKKIAREEALG